ncbi:MAG: PucR family transcriptional regulator [Lachnospiraceae bacterium]
MKLPLELIRDSIHGCRGTLSCHTDRSFRTWYQVLCCGSGDNQSFFSDPCCSTDGSDPDCADNFLLLGKAEDFPPDIAGRGLICIGVPSSRLLENNDILYFEDNCCLQEIYLEIQKIYLKFQNWEDALNDVLNNHPSLDALLTLAADVFENSVFLHDENFNLLSSVNEMPGQMSWEYDPVKGGYILPLDVLNDFKVNQDYLDSMSTSGPSLFPDDTFGYRILYQNLRYHGRYLGRICVNELGRKLRDSDWFLLDCFSQVVLNSFRIEEIVIHKHAFSLSRFLICLIERESIDPGALDEILLQYGWTSGDEYFCACLFPEERDIRTNSIRYLCSRISEHFPHTCAFPYEQSIVVLINSTRSQMTIPDFRNRIGVLLRESLMKAGISCSCSDLTQFYYLYRQAVCALETGEKSQETFWTYCFEDYRTDFIFQHALQEFPAEMLCSKEIFLLKDYDAGHTSQLGTTLKIFLENERNLTKTAEILQIHRSTLLYRIDRIKEITRLNLDDPKIRFRLMMSYCFLEESR